MYKTFALFGSFIWSRLALKWNRVTGTTIHVASTGSRFRKVKSEVKWRSTYNPRSTEEFDLFQKEYVER